MKNQNLICLLALMFGLFSANHAVAEQETVFQDDFENVTAVIWPDFGSDADPVAQTGTWAQIIEQRTGIPDSVIDIQVSRNVVPGPTDGGNYLTVDRKGYAYLRGNFDRTAEFGHLIIEFDLYVKAIADNPNDAYNNGFQIMIRNAVDDSLSTLMAIRDSFRANGTITHHQETGDETLGQFVTDQWNPIKYDIHISEGTYTLTVGADTYTDLSFYSPQSQIRQILFYAMFTRTLFYLDDVSASVFICDAPLKGDFNRDCLVNLSDLAVLVQNWLECHAVPMDLCD